MKVFDWIVYIWTINKEIINPEIIVVISYGSLPGQLTTGSTATFLKGIEILNLYPKATLIWGVFRHSFDAPFGTKEMQLKKDILDKFQITREKCIGPISSTVEEATTAAQILTAIPQRIVVVTGEIHSRSAGLVWKKYFSSSQIGIAAIPYREEVQIAHPMIFLRWRWSWLIVNLIRHLVLLLPGGIKLITHLGIRQPTWQ